MNSLDLDNLPFAFLPVGAVPLPTLPVSFRSMYQSLVSPLPFLSVNAKMAPPFFMASFRSASSERAEEIRSKASEEGQAPVGRRSEYGLSNHVDVQIAIIVLSLRVIPSCCSATLTGSIGLVYTKSWNPRLDGIGSSGKRTEIQEQEKVLQAEVISSLICSKQYSLISQRSLRT